MSESWEILQREADACTKCGLKGILEIDCPRETIGIPMQIDNPSCLFVSWNPPKREPRASGKAGKAKNFWNDSEDTLQKNLLEILKLNNIEEFRSQGYFLVHALKCPVLDPRRFQSGRQLTRIALSTCVPEYLQKEVALLSPKRICLLGTVAKQAFGLFCKDVREWQASPRDGESRKIKLEHSVVDFLYTCLPVRDSLVPYTKTHLLLWKP